MLEAGKQCQVTWGMWHRSTYTLAFYNLKWGYTLLKAEAGKQFRSEQRRAISF